MYFYLWRKDSQDEISEMLGCTVSKIGVEPKGEYHLHRELVWKTVDY